MKKLLIVGSSGNLGLFLRNNLKKKFKVLGISRKKKIYDNFYCEDLANFRLCLNTINDLYKKNNTLDGIVICTGNSKKSNNSHLDEKYLNSIKSNLLTVSNTVESYQKIYKNNPTKIIVISSIAGIDILNAPIEYSVSKSALNHYCRIKAKELAKFKINLNIISPGNILNKNNNWYKKIKLNKNKVDNYIKKTVPLNDFCRPNYILSLCHLLLSEEGKFFQGSNLIIDGGQSL